MMEDFTLNDIKKAMKILEKNNKVPKKMYMNPATKDKVIKMLNEQGIETKCADGNDYVFGMKAVTIDALSEEQI